jgi:hypothetical protein
MGKRLGTGYVLERLRRQTTNTETAFEKQHPIRASYLAGAKYAAGLTQELGEILQKYSDAMTPKDMLAVREIFRKNKEIVDEQ